MHSLVSPRLVMAGCVLSFAVTGAAVHAADPSNISPAPAAGQLQPTAPLQLVALSPASAGVAPRPLVPSRVAWRPAADAPASGARYALGYFGGSASRASLSQLPRRNAIRPAPLQPMRGPTKPFETIYREPTISPYLNLYREEDDAEGAPNYHTFVRPYQQQIETNRLQQRELQRLRGQVQGLSTTVATPQYGDASLPATGTRSRYMDTAQFYGGWRR
jgi:hypothetical protein